MDKLRVKGLGSVILLGEPPELQKEYILSLRIERKKDEIDHTDKENPETTYVCQYLTTEQLIEVGSRKKLETQKGKTQSQVLRWAIYDNASASGADPEEYYKKEMSRYIEEQKAKLE